MWKIVARNRNRNNNSDNGMDDTKKIFDAIYFYSFTIAFFHRYFFRSLFFGISFFFFFVVFTSLSSFVYRQRSPQSRPFKWRRTSNECVVVACAKCDQYWIVVACLVRIPYLHRKLFKSTQKCNRIVYERIHNTITNSSYDEWDVCNTHRRTRECANYILKSSHSNIAYTGKTSKWWRRHEYERIHWLWAHRVDQCWGDVHST